MTPVNQSKLYCSDGIHNGNCYAACLASLLNVPLWMVPPFEDMFARVGWRARVQEWLRRLFDLEQARIEGHNPAALPEFYIANGLSKRGVHHSVIYSAGELVHDPHPSGDGIVDVEWCWFLRRPQE